MLGESDGDAILFGTDVLDPNGQSTGVVGQGGQLFVRGAEEGGVLQVRWGDGEARQCKVSYQLPARTRGEAWATIDSVDATCH